GGAAVAAQEEGAAGGMARLQRREQLLLGERPLAAYVHGARENDLAQLGPLDAAERRRNQLAPGLAPAVRGGRLHMRDRRPRRRTRERSQGEVQVAGGLLPERRHRATIGRGEDHDARRRPAGGSEPGPLRAEGFVGIESDRSEERSGRPVASAGWTVEPCDGIGRGEGAEQVAKLSRRARLGAQRL